MSVETEFLNDVEQKLYSWRQKYAIISNGGGEGECNNNFINETFNVSIGNFWHAICILCKGFFESNFKINEKSYHIRNI